METFGAWWDNIWDWLKPDANKINKDDLKAATTLAIKAMKPATTWPMDFDDKAWDMLNSAAHSAIDQIGVKQPLVVGAENYTAADVDSYLSTFSNVSESVRERLRGKPRTLAILKERFTPAQQERIVGNPFLIFILTTFGPMIVKWIIEWLSNN